MAVRKITREDAERIATRTFLLATLTARGPEPQFHESLVDTVNNLHKCGIKYQLLQLSGCSDLAYGRNLTAARFLSSDCTDLIFIDDDICWMSEDIMRLIASEHDVIGGLYRRKISEYPEDHVLAWAFKMLPRDATERDDNGSYTIERNGMGFIKISREALERIVDLTDIPRIYDESAKGMLYRFFHFDGLGGSEDYHFCDLWRSVGGKVWGDPNIRLGHVGKHIFTGGPMIILGGPRKDLNDDGRQ